MTFMRTFSLSLMQKFFFITSFISALFPVTTFAQSGGGACSASLSTVSDIFVYGTCLLNRTVVPLLITVALIMFLFGVVKFIANSGDEAGRKEGKQFILWGIIGLFVMISIFGILSVLVNTFGVTTFSLPQFQA